MDSSDSLLGRLGHDTSVMQVIESALKDLTRNPTMGSATLVDALRQALDALRISDERFEIVARATNDIVWDWDFRNGTWWWSENVTSALGYDRAELGPSPEAWFEFIHPQDRARVVAGIRQAIDSNETDWRDEYRIRHRDGRYLTIFDRGFVIRDESAKPLRMIGAKNDITARREAERVNALQAMQQSLLADFGQKALASTNLDAIMHEAVTVIEKGIGTTFCRVMQLGTDGTALTFKAGAGWDARWTGRHSAPSDPDAFTRYALHVSSAEPIVVDNFQLESRLSASQILQEHDISSGVEVLIRGPSGVYGMLGAYSVDTQAFGADKISFLRSVATTLGTAVERVGSDERMAYLAQFDTLTGLPNRNLFHDRIEQTLTLAARNGWQVGVLYVDLDRFKIVNDTYGHGVGDTLLLLVANRLGNCVCAGDTVGRLGGDEFAIVLPKLVSADEANVTAQKILDELAHPFNLDGYETYVTASIGIAVFPSDGGDSAVLLKNADTAMSRAKEQGRNNFQFYTQALNARITHRVNLERELRHALDRSELQLHYQPQVSLDTGRIVAAEALVRWSHPKRGLLSPAEFMGVAQESGLIVPIGQWVIDTACAQTMAWHRKGHSELTIAVNVSPAEMRRESMPEVIRAALERAGMAPQNFEVEITESMAMESAESFIETLHALKAVGVMIAIDDFGTGYSNLSYLKRFPIDTIKVDQIFIRDIVTDTDDAAIIRAIIAMAHQLKLEVVAEGVETEAQASFLRRNHVDLVQGYLFAPALDAAAFGQLLDTHMSRPLPTTTSESARSLLLVDDEENILRALKRTLRQDGYQIHTASSAREGLDVLARIPIGVIVSDERMPEMNGTEFLGRVKTLYPNTVRIMLSGYTDLKVVTAAVNEGAIYKFLTKPWEDASLREDVRQAFRRQEEKSESRAESGSVNERT
jgi:diguanylate cyclase (GGDEF)-like protein/PAS domain S-box-containing protein